MAIDPFFGAVAAAAIPVLFGNNDSQQTSGVDPSDFFSRTKGRLGAETPEDAMLTALQQSLFRATAENALGGGIPAALDPERLASGRLSAQSHNRLDRAAFGGMEESLRRAFGIASENAQSRGIGMSGIESVNAAELSRPIISQAGQLRAQMEGQELGRLTDLRDRLMANMMAIQNSPTLNRLLQIRMAEAEQDQLNLSRFPGGLPDWVQEDLGVGELARRQSPEEIAQQERILEESRRRQEGWLGTGDRNPPPPPANGGPPSKESWWKSRV